MALLSYDEAYAWLAQVGTGGKPHLLLGNGFSVAFDRDRFSYKALRTHAIDQGSIGSLSEKFFEALDTYDFEVVIRQLQDAARALEVLDPSKYATEIGELDAEASQLKETLAQSLASLHPERPGDIPDAAYTRVRAFLNRHSRVYTANYDLLLYWSVMQDPQPGADQFRATDDGFRNGDLNDPFVVWDYLDPHKQTIFYLHGALHLYRDTESASLQKLTWIRTGEPLIDQIRGQLAADRFPLIVTEGSSAEKLARIQTSDYLSKGLRSLAAIGGSLLVFGLSMSANDAHIMRAIARSKVQRLAVSVFGDPASDANRETIEAASTLVGRRQAVRPNVALDVDFFAASTLPLWSEP